MEEGFEAFLSVLSAAGIPCTCFATGDVARRYPRAMDTLLQRGHELASHGDTHRRFSTMTYEQARAEIAQADAELRRFSPITSFRAPNLDFPNRFIPLLEAAGYTIDSSIAAYKPHKGHPRAPLRHGAITRLPASTMPSLVRLPGSLQRLVLAPLRDASVLFFHPWEFVDLRRAPIPWDCRAGTGPHALASLETAIATLAARGAQFLTLRDLAAQVAI